MTAHALPRDLPITGLPAMCLVAGKKPSVNDIYPRLFDAILEQRHRPLHPVDRGKAWAKPSE